MKKGFWAFLHAILYPLIYISSQMVVAFAAILAFFIGKAMEGDLSFAEDPAAGIQERLGEFTSAYSQLILIGSCLITILVVLLILKMNKKRIRDAFIIKPISLSKAAVVFILGIAINIVTSFVLSILPIPEAVLKQYEELVSSSVLSDNLWLTVLTTALLVPITEEMVFRGMSFNVLRRGMPLALAVVFQTLIFAGGHMIPLQIAYVIPTALILGLVYVWCGSFLAPVLLHIAFNGVSAVASFIPTTADNTAVAEAAGAAVMTVENYWTLGVATLVMLLCLLFLYRKRERRIQPSMKERGIEI